MDQNDKEKRTLYVHSNASRGDDSESNGFIGCIVLSENRYLCSVTSWFKLPVIFHGQIVKD